MLTRPVLQIKCSLLLYPSIIIPPCMFLRVAAFHTKIHLIHFNFFFNKCLRIGLKIPDLCVTNKSIMILAFYFWLMKSKISSIFLIKLNLTNGALCYEIGEKQKTKVYLKMSSHNRRQTPKHKVKT